MPLELVHDAPPGDFRNARFLAMACDLAYYNEPQGPQEFLEKLGLKAKLISVGNTQAYVGCNDTAIVVAFRGSESPTNFDGLKDWLLTNASNFLILPEGEIGTDFAAAGVGARFHKGFLMALNAIWAPLYAEVDARMQEKERLLWVTGHSLGGALALVAAWRFQRNFLSVHQVITFGAPMIGNAAAAEAFHREFPNKIFRCVDHADFVPKLPTISLAANDYGHCQMEMGLGALAAESADSALGYLKSLGSKTVDGILNATLIDDIWKGFTSRIEAHLMANYRGRIDEKIQG
jgi:hypothetical protein